MVTIDNLSFNEDYRVLNVEFRVDLNSDPASRKLFIYPDECYLSKTPIDVSAYIGVISGDTYNAAIPIEALISAESPACGYDKPIFDGVFAVHVETNIGGAIDEAEKSITNLYYASLCFSHSVLAIDTPDKLNEVNLMYLLMNAVINYIALDMTEQALEAYAKVVALCESAPAEFYETDVAACGIGLGCWIVNGVYVKR